jgi:SSS family solute:Na+ symporter
VYIFIFTVVNLFIKGSVLYPVSRLVSSSLGLPLIPSTIVLGFFMISYTAVGGLWAVMVTDILQFVVLSAAVFILLPLSFDMAGGVEGFVQHVPDDFFNLLNGEYTVGFILAFTIFHIAYIGGNWTFVQRYTSVDSPRSAKKVAFLFAALYLISPVIWMMPPMIYKAINPSLTGLETENAYLQMCKLVLPPGLLGLMLTGMYFSTSASANTALNVVSAVFTNDIYKGMVNPGASDAQLMRIARRSSWVFGLGMILIALIIPYVGGIVEVILSIGAVTGGPLLAPPLWALFSRKLSGKAALRISIFTLFVNLIFKIAVPLIFSYKLSRELEMILGVGLPLILLAINEWVIGARQSSHPDHDRYMGMRAQAGLKKVVMEKEVESDVPDQNRFGLRVIGWSLVFTAVMLFGLSAITEKGAVITAIMAVLILLGSSIPFRAQYLARKKRK